MINKILFLVLLFLSIPSHSRVDIVDWSVLETKWREPLCLEEAVYPINFSRASQIATVKEQKIKTDYGVKKLASIAYKKTQPEPKVIDRIREVVLLKALVAARAKKKQRSRLAALKKYAKSAYTVCSRVLNKYPSTRCHDFLLITIKPNEFSELVGGHFNQYQESAIYSLDMRNHCRDIREPDWSCSELAKDYFAKNHLESCIAGQLEPPEKLEPVSLLGPTTGE